jgi:hypothetical protein
MSLETVNKLLSGTVERPEFLKSVSLSSNPNPILVLLKDSFRGFIGALIDFPKLLVAAINGIYTVTLLP